MQRLFIMTLATLTMIVASAVGAIAWQSASFSRTAPDIGAGPAVGLAFYKELDRTLAGAPARALTGIVSDDFVDHASDPADSRSASQLFDELATMAGAFPGIDLEVDSIRAEGNILIARVTLVAPVPGQVAGLSIMRLSVTQSIEILHIRRGLVSERWASWLPALTFSSLDAATYFGVGKATVAPRLFQITLPPHGGLSWDAGDIGIVLVQLGTVEATFEISDYVDRPVQQTKTIAAGEAISIPPGARAHFASGDAGGARVLLFAAHLSGQGREGPFQLDGEARGERLWSSNTSWHVAALWQIRIGQIELPPTMEVRLSNTSEAYLLLAIQHGASGVSVLGGAVRQLDDRQVVVPIASPSVARGNSVVEIAGAERLRLGGAAGESSTVWLITIGPVDPDAAESSIPAFIPRGPGPQP